MQRRYDIDNFCSDDSDYGDTFEQPACSKGISGFLKSLCADDDF